MTQPNHQFRAVRRGYDPAEVDQVLADLHGRLTATEHAAAGLQARLARAEAAASVADESAAQPASFGHLGERVGQILALAEQEAMEVRDRVTAEAEAIRKDAEQAAVTLRTNADEYSEQRRRDADAEGTRLLTDARRAADEERDAAERDSAARRQEAEAIYEQQRANSAQAAADFEATLAERRQRTTAEFQEQQAATQAQLDEMAARVEDMKAAAQRERTEAEAEARRIVEEAEERAAVLTRDARTAADRVRVESDRELAAASQRRDSINAQLTNVRQMLATLTGSVPSLVAQEDASEQEATAEPDDGDDGESGAAEDAPAEVAPEAAGKTDA
jgi:DivIVA domain-containing protein